MGHVQPLKNKIYGTTVAVTLGQDTTHYLNFKKEN